MPYVAFARTRTTPNDWSEIKRMYCGKTEEEVMEWANDLLICEDHKLQITVIKTESVKVFETDKKPKLAVVQELQ